MTAPRWQGQIVNPADGKPKVWDTYDTRDRAESIAATLRQHGIFAHVRRLDGPTPELQDGAQ